MNNILPTKKQHALLEFIGAFVAEHNYAPSYREVARALDYKSVSTVAKHIDGLIERGWLAKRDNSKRSLEVVYGQGPDAAEKSPALELPPDSDVLVRDRIMRKLAQPDLAANDAEVLRRAATILDLDLSQDVDGAADATGQTTEAP